MSTHNRWMMIILVLVLVSAAAVQMVSAETAHVANHVVISEVCVGLMLQETNLSNYTTLPHPI